MVGISLGLHVVAAQAMLYGANPLLPALAPLRSWVDLEWIAEEQEEEPPPAVVQPEPTSAPRADPTPSRSEARRRPTKTRAPAVLGIPTDGPAEFRDATLPTPAIDAPVAPARDLSTIDLNPRSVARAALPAATGPPDEEDLDTRVSRGLYADANAKRYITQRPPPRLEPRSDGTYAWNGPVVQAVIQTDGTVRFTDPQSGVRVDDNWRPSLQFDLSDAIERRNGNDPYAAEKRWFLRQTEAVRDELGQQHRATLASRGEGRLRRRLQRIWRRSSDSPSDRRRQIFDIWDDCSDDDVGRRARDEVMRFVRAELRGDDAYTAAELRSLNAQRISRDAFAP